MTPKGNMRTLVVMLALAASLWGCGLHGKPEVARKARPVNASGVAPAPRPEAGSAEMVPETLVAPGIVEPWGDSVSLSAQESGWIAQLHVTEGEVVQAGQLLATLEDTSQRYALDLARADLAEAEAILAKVERGATAEEVRQVQADYEAATAQGDLARSTAARTTRLHAAKVVADNEAERASAEAHAELARANGAAARLREVKQGARAEDRNAARARAAAARARLLLAEASLARRRVISPVAGTVLLSRFHPGEFYNVGAGPLFVLGDLTRLQVRLEVDEIDAPDVIPGVPCEIYSDGDVRLTEGTIVRLAPRMGRRVLSIESPTARADVRVREVFVEIPTTSRLVPGQRVWGHAARIGPSQDITRSPTEGQR